MSTETGSRFLPAAISAWVSFLALDFLTHAVLLASWWRATESYWLPPSVLFQKIPFAYASFAIFCGALVWLQLRLLGPRPAIGPSLLFGVSSGLVFGSSLTLATYSVFRMPVSALFVWPLSFTVESTAAAAASCFVLTAARPWRAVLLILAFAVLVFAAGIVLQNTFFSVTEHAFALSRMKYAFQKH